jgi:lysophospholipase L1-like esterase
VTSTATKALRILVIGNSVPVLVVPPRASRAEGTYGEVLERLLDGAGVPATVENQARLFELLYEGKRRFRHELLGRFPDVLIVHYGILEQQPNVAPSTVVRYLTRRDVRVPGWRGFVQHHAHERLGPHVRRYQRWASRRAGTRTWRMAPERFRDALVEVIGLARSTGAFVLVVDTHRPNDRLEHFLPGLTPRWESFRELFRRIVDELDDPLVKLVESSKVVDGIGDPPGTVDGLHLTAAAHAALAEVLADEILEWREP